MVEFHDDVTILVTEDDDGHAELIVEYLLEAGIKNNIIRFRDGLELWEYLQEKKSEPQAYLLLLDIRMPRLDGVEVLKRIKNDDELKKIPVIMLTTTDDPREIEACYKLGCSSYITKPLDFSKFAETLKRLGLFVMVIRVAKVY